MGLCTQKCDIGVWGGSQSKKGIWGEKGGFSHVGLSCLKRLRDLEGVKREPCLRNKLELAICFQKSRTGAVRIRPAALGSLVSCLLCYWAGTCLTCCDFKSLCKRCLGK